MIPQLITQEQNEQMEKSPFKDEVKQVIFALNDDSASGLGAFSRQFFQSS